MPAVSSPPAARTLAIASGKGGVGKTLLAVALAQAFARRGERVLLFDGDLGMANVDVQLGLSPRADISAVIAGRTPLAGAVTPAGGGTGNGGFDVIAGRSGSGALTGLSAERVAGLASAIAALSLSYDRVLMDLAAGAEPSSLRLAASADEVLVVLTDEPTSITDAYAFVKMLRMQDEGAAPMVVANMVESAEQARRTYGAFARTCRAFLGFEPVFCGHVRRDPAASAAIRRQLGLLDFAPGAPAALDLLGLATALGASRAACAA